MRKLLASLLLTLAPAALQTTALNAATVRVAAVGDSITYGSGIQDRERNAYPAQLDRMLGEGFAVRNFGVSGATLLKKGDLPYWEQGAFKAALEYQPDIVVIKLGTNDSKPQNWRHKGEYLPDLIEMVDTFAALESKPKIFVAYPVPVYENRWGITESVVQMEVIPRIQELAKVRPEVELIDLYTPLSGKEEMLPDKIHPNSEGAREMAKVIEREIRNHIKAVERAGE